MVNVNRREFVVIAGAAAACACGSELLVEPSLAAPSRGKVDIGTVADYPADGCSEKFAKSNKLLVVRHEGRIYAINAVCTHKACVVRLKGGALKCPCHGSTFSPTHGTVTAGPAKVSLFRYKIQKTDDGRLTVDKSKQFTEREWDKPGSFVQV